MQKKRDFLKLNNLELWYLHVGYIVLHGLDAKMQKRNFLKNNNLELWCLLTTYRKLCNLNWAFQKTHYLIPTIQDG